MMIRNTMMISMLSLVALLFVGCARTPEQRLTGTWALDVDATLDLMVEGEEEITERALAVHRRELEESRSSFTFNADGTASLTHNHPLRAGTLTTEYTWRLTPAEGDTNTLELTEGEGDEADTEEVILNFTGDNSFTITDGRDLYVFSRQ